MADKITKDTFPRYKPQANDFPAHLKDPKNYNAIQKALLETLAGGHTHSELVGWANCVTCQNKLANHGLMMRKLGFKSSAHYMSWKKIMSNMISIKRVKLR